MRELSVQAGFRTISEFRRIHLKSLRRLFVDDWSFAQAYNCLAAVGRESQVTVAEDAAVAPNDKEQVRPMVEQTRKNLDAAPKKLSGDSGFSSDGNVTYLCEAGVEDYLCPDCLKHGECRPAVRSGTRRH